MPMVRALPSQAELRAMFDYDRTTGVLYWKRRADRSPQWNGRRAGTVAGSLECCPGRCVINIMNRLVLAHRVVWKLVYGEDAPLDIDHIDGDATNNRLENLRLATKHQNLRNSKLHRGKLTPKGVSYDKRNGKYRASIYVEGKCRHLGHFGDPNTAHAAYCAAARQHFGEFARFA